MPSKRQELIGTAFQLFYRKGIHAVGINEILTTSGIAKKTLYNHFKSKEDLLLATLQYRDDIYCDWLQTELDQAVTGISKIETLFDSMNHWFNDRIEALAPFHGCFFINVSAEYGGFENPINDYCKRHKSRIKNMIEDACKTLPYDEKKIKSVVEMICLLKEGAIVLARIEGDKKAALRAKLAIKEYANNLI